MAGNIYKFPSTTYLCLADHGAERNSNSAPEGRNRCPDAPANFPAKAIIGNKLAPDLLDRYLAKVGYDAQQTDEPVNPDRPSNLFEPVVGDHGAHGIFGDHAHETSIELWKTTHRGWLALAGVSAAGMLSWKLLKNKH